MAALTAVRVFRLRLAYDGTSFHGWQRQPELRTVQGELEGALLRVFGTTTTTHAAGRTDAGVHARGQVASFLADTPVPAHALVPLLRRELPADIQPIEAHEMPDQFEARRSAGGRRYAYRLLDRDDVLWRRVAWWPGRVLDPEALETAVGTLVGEHDFSAFQAQGSSPVSPVCDMRHAHWSRWDAGWMLTLIADHFVYHMVRNIVGTALEVMPRADPAGEMARILASRSRSQGGRTTPPQALCLEEVFYP